MSLLPVLPQPARARSDAAPSTQTERRNADSSRDQFATRLADARTDRGLVSTCSPTRNDRAALANAAPDSEEYAAAKMRLVTQQRAQVSALILSGAMKFAVTKNDAATTATLPDVAVSQPDMIAIPTTDDVAADVAAMLANAPTDIADIVPQTMRTDVQTPSMPVAMQLTAVMQAMPEVTTVTDAELTDEPAVVATTDAGADAGADLTASNAVTAAALQMIASLPIEIEVPTPTPDAAAMDSVNEPAADTTDATLSLQGAVASLPERIDTTLVEDHFDAPAAALDLAAQTATPTTSSTSTNAAAATTVATSSANVSAATSRAASASAEISSVQTDLAKLDPEFRDRLQKVIDRMRSEFGHAVKVVETVRSQSRQDALFAQGRTEPGPVVTWTKNSKHGKGLAADLMVDGAWQNPMGYAHLADVAKQEGLRTLGSRDPGHVELPSESSVSGETLGNLLNDLQGDAGDTARQMRADVNSGAGGESRAALMNRVTNVAQVARVATVASVAQVARVATVARPGAAAAPAATNDAISPLAVSAAPSLVLSSDAVNVMRVATPVSGVNMSDRISHLLDLQATQDAKPLSSVLLRMDNANGIEDQIRVDTRGTSVDARLGLGNAQQAAALTDRLGELREALERRGLTADSVRVQAASNNRSIDTANFARPVAPTIELAAMRAAADSQAQGNPRDQSTRDQAQREAFARDQSRHSPRPSTDDARQRSRREQPEERR